MIGRIERVPLRDVWSHEAYDFTTWLQENLDVLNDVTGLDLSDAAREQAAGPFSIDLVAQARSGATVVIENQLDKSDHDHLGKLITYLTSVEATVAIWIVAEPRPEHVRAVAWLNDAKDVAFYLVKLEAVRIAGSPAAPLLTAIVGPSEATREAGAVKRELAERHHERHAFWTDLLAHVNGRTKLHANLSPGHETWLGTGAGRMGLTYVYVVNQHSARVQLYIDRGKEAGDENIRIFEQLRANAEAIEVVFEGSLEWHRSEGTRACWVTAPIPFAGYRDVDERAELIDAMVTAMIRLEGALAPFVAELQI